MFQFRPRLARRVYAIAVCSLIVVAGQGRVAFAQETPPTTPAPPAAASDWERLVYVPYRNLKQVFDKDGAAVFMPYNQFQKLWERLRRPDGTGPATPPINAVVTSATYSGRIEKDVARIDVELTVQVLGKPWVELPIRFGEAAIGKFAPADPNILLQGTGQGAYTLLFPKAGEQKVKFELEARVQTSPDGRSLEMECPPAGLTTFDLQVPAADQAIEILPRGVVTPGAAPDQATRVKASLGATSKISARWRPRVSTAPVMEVLTSVQNTLDVRVADGLVHSHATLKYQVLRGQLDQLQIAVPLEHRVLDVSAPGLKGWKAARQEKQQVVTVDLLGGEARSITVEVHTEHPLPAGEFAPAGREGPGSVWGIHALGEVRENGLLILSQGADLSLTVEQQTGLVRIESSEVSETLRRPETLYFKYYTPDFRIQVAAQPVEPRILADHHSQFVFRDDELQLVSNLVFTVERAGVFELRFQLPPDLRIDRVDCEAMKEFQTPEGTDQLIVGLREKSKGLIAVVVTAHRSLDPADREASRLPILEPLNLSRENGTVAVYAPPAIEVLIDQKGVQGAQPSRIDAAEAARIPQARLVSTWTYTRRPEIPVRTERKPTRLLASVATTVNLLQDRTEVTTRLTYDVLFAGIDRFVIAVPEAVAAGVQIEAADSAVTPIQQQSREPEATDGWVPFTVVLQREVTGRVPFRIRYDLPSAGQEKKPAAATAIAPLRLLPTPGKTDDAPAVAPKLVLGEITILKDRAFSVSAKGDDLEPIDVRELTLLPREGYLAYRYFKQPERLADGFTLELTASRNEIQPVVETIISQALVEAVLTEDKSVTYRCRYRLKTSERQRLSVELPENAEILDTLVAGKRVELEKGDQTGNKQWDAFHLNVARATPSDEPFVVALAFRAPYKDQPLRGRGGNLELRLPRIGGATADGARGIALQQLRTAVWVPREYTLVGTPQDFTPQHAAYINLLRGAVGYISSTADLEAWFGDPGSGLFAFTPAGHAYVYHRLGAADTLALSYWRTAWFTWLLSLTVVVVGLVLSRTTWENRLTIVLVLGLAAALYALRDRDLVVNLLAASRFGLIASVAYWVLHSLTRPGAKVPRFDLIPRDPATAVSMLGAVLPPPERPAE
ncbi:MAG: hypothetical protein ACKV0T_01330 [Planctomycetales bacterium]